MTAGGSGPDSSELVRRSQAGDGEAFAQLYDRYVQQVYRYVFLRVGRRELAEDLTSETFSRALQKIGGWTWQGRDVGAWFVTIARNLIADHYKSSRYRLEVSTDDLSSLSAVPVVESPEAAVLARSAAGDVIDAVRRLAADQQECVSLRFLQGLSLPETAEIMGRSPGAVAALTRRAVVTLKGLLPPDVRTS